MPWTFTDIKMDGKGLIMDATWDSGGANEVIVSGYQITRFPDASNIVKRATCLVYIKGDLERIRDNTIGNPAVGSINSILSAGVNA